jgi:hypothetical protein
MKGTREVDHVTRYTVGTSGRQTMNSFRKHDHRPEDCGYRNVMTDELVFPDGGVHAPSGAW